VARKASSGNNNMTILITGSLGLIGSTAAQYFLEKGHRVIGVDNDMRSVFFGKQYGTTSKLKKLKKSPNYQHLKADIRDQQKISSIFEKQTIDAVIHAAGQPGHDKAAEIPLIDFEVNAAATVQLLEIIRQYAPETVFIFTSTNKVYGDLPNQLPMKEKAMRYEYKDSRRQGIDEDLPIDQSLHSLMGASKAAADIYVQEYGRYFGLKTTVLRLGCTTGRAHAGAPHHGFLSFLVKSLVNNNAYNIIGYQGKQVRDQLHAWDLASAFAEIIKNPKKGAVYNLGGGQVNNASIKELIKKISKKLGTKPKITYQKEARKGDHILYITDFTKFQKDYPDWQITRKLDDIIDELISYESPAADHQ
jgi:CDP-paratose 2-epimerase